MNRVKTSIRANYLVTVGKEEDSYVLVTVLSVGAFMVQTYLLLVTRALWFDINPEFTFAFIFYFGSTTVFLIVFFKGF